MKQIVALVIVIPILFSCATNISANPATDTDTMILGGQNWQTSEYLEVPITPYEQWEINGEIFEIAQTVVTGGLLYTVHAVVEHQPVMDEYNEEIAKDLARHAVLNGYLGNAMKYNQYDEEQFYVRDSMIGVSLIKIHNPVSGEISGARFAFEISEILPELEDISEIELPDSFDENAQKNIKEQIGIIFESRRFDDIFSLYSENALLDIDEDSRLHSKLFMSLAKEYVFEERESFTVYIGSMGGIKGYHHYIPVTVIPVSDETQRLDAFLQILIVDESPRFGIYAMMLNFTDYNSMRILHGGSDGVEFPVLKD